MSSPTSASIALAALWRAAALDPAALERATTSGTEPVLPSSFAAATAVQAALAAAALAAAEVGRLRNGIVQHVGVDAAHAVAESSAYFTVQGTAPPIWDPLSGLYRCADGHVRLHANFVHHRDGALRLLGLPAGSARDVVAQAFERWPAVDFEQAAADAGLVAAAVRSFEQWDAHAQAAALAREPLVAIERIGDAPPRAWPALAATSRPLAGLRVLDLTRILAGPAGARTLAAFGADVLMVNGPQLPNIESIADLSRGKRSALLDLRDDAGRAQLRALAASAHVFLQGYRPGALAGRGFAPEALAALAPGLVCASLCAYGWQGPWAGRRGFDSLVQSATGLNVAEAEAAGAAEPKALPIQALDYGAGYLLAFGIAAALQRQAVQGGSWHVRVSLAGTGRWLRGLGRVQGAFGVARPSLRPYLESAESGWGTLVAVRPAAQFSATPAGYDRPSMPPGSDAPAWL